MLDSILIIIIGFLGGVVFTKKFLQKTKIIIEKPDENYIKALNSIMDGDLKKAQELLMDTVDINPENIMAYQRLAEIKYNHGNYVKALKIFEIVTMRTGISNDELIRAYRGCGKIYNKLGKNDKAIEIYNKVLDISSNDIESVEALRNLYEKKKDWDNALKIQKKLKDITGKDDKVYSAYLLSLKAEDYYKKRHLKEAEKIANDARDEDESCILAYIVLGDILNENNTKDAIAEWEKAVNIKPNLAFTVFKRLEKAYFENNEYEKMISIYEKILKADPKSAVTHAALGDLYFNMGNFVNALTEYRESLQHGFVTNEIGQNVFRIYKEEKKLESFFNEIEIIFTKIEKDNKYSCQRCKHHQNDFFWKCPVCGKIVYE